MVFSPIDEIKNRLDIVEVVGSYVKLQKTGINYRACCPFHSEKKPSFFVSPARQIFHCFGCGAGGGMFDFVMKIEGVEFGDALRILAKKVGVELKKQSPEYAALRTEKEKLYEICELATRFFEKQLNESAVGKEAKAYLLNRKINEESIKKWRIGYAPDVWQGLSDFLDKRGYKKAEIEKAGLALTSEKGSFYDRFRGRIIFPVFDINSQVVGFGGRVFKDRDKNEIAKYINTPQTVLYDKGRILYGLDKAKVAIRRENYCILVEGYVDLIMICQAGFENVVATSGTALTFSQLKLLKRYSDNLHISFDMDVAGDTATKRGIELAQAQEFNIKVITYPEGKDPADLIAENSKIWEESVKGAKSILDFYFESTFARFNKDDPEGKREISKILLPPIKRISSKIVQSYWIGELAKKLSVKEDDIREELKKVKLENYSESLGLEPEEIKNMPSKTRRELLEERVIILLVKSPKNMNIVKEKENIAFISPLKDIFAKLKEKPDLKGEDLDPEMAGLFNPLALRAEIEEIQEKELVPELECCLKEIFQLDLKDKLDQITRELRKAEGEKDPARIEELTKKFNQLMRTNF
ncbi:MAG: DNA primase [Candidatus Pacebacteria bacterium]|nr:DNA primase [Candidatus Paceibacterota bacterium]